MKSKTYLQELNEAVASIDTQPTYDFSAVSEWVKIWKLGTNTSLDEFIKGEGQAIQ